MKLWMPLAILSWIGTALMLCVLALMVTGHLNWWVVAMLAAGGPLSMAVLFVPAEGPYWKREVYGEKTGVPRSDPELSGAGALRSAVADLDVQIAIAKTRPHLDAADGSPVSPWPRQR